MIAVEPLTPLPTASRGAASATGRTAMLLRTEWLCGLLPFFSTQVMEPKVYWPSGAVVRVMVTEKLFDWPGGITRWVGLTFTVVPAGAWICTS